MTYIKTGFGFHAGQNFARAKEDIPIEITDTKPAGLPAGHVVGVIQGDKNSPHTFLRFDRIKVVTLRQAIGGEQ